MSVFCAVKRIGVSGFLQVNWFSLKTGAKMVVGYSVNHLYKHPVEKVVEAHMSQLKPTFNKEIVKVEMVERRNETDGFEYVKRVITAFNTLPTIIRKVGMMDDTEIQTEEEIWLDYSGRRFWLRQHNVSFPDQVTMLKNSTFVVDSHNPQWTCFEQVGAADMNSQGFIGKVLEVFYKNVMEREVHENVKLMEKILQEKL